jgi:DNA replication initiation complex subunit (GINS family)
MMLFRTEYAGGKRGRMDILTWVTAVRRHLEAEAEAAAMAARRGRPAPEVDAEPETEADPEPETSAAGGAEEEDNTRMYRYITLDDLEEEMEVRPAKTTPRPHASRRAHRARASWLSAPTA